jgi:hypothetical protein
MRPARLLPSPLAQYKEKFLPPQTLQALNPEQEALIDFLVLSNSNNFVGLGSSTFSVYLRCVGQGQADMGGLKLWWYKTMAGGIAFCNALCRSRLFQ